MMSQSARALWKSTDWKELAILSGLTTVLLLLWGTPAVYPLKILVVVFHELSHGLTALVTGGAIKEIQINPQQGGLCVTAGGSRFLVLSAGYVGSLLWGGAILLLTKRPRAARVLAVALGALLLVVSLVLVRPFLGFGFFFCGGTGAALVLVGVRLPGLANALLLKLIGLTSCLYAVTDIYSDILQRPGLQSDARMLAEYTGVPTIFWGALWIAISVAATAFFAVAASRKVDEESRD
jgi:Peptidase M50B-like